MVRANYYRIFALQPSATAVDIKRRYRQLSFKYHPDRGGDEQKMVLINEAYSVLSNGLLRREYDRRYAAQQAATVYAYDTVVRPHYAQPAPFAYESVRRQYTDDYQQHNDQPQRSHFWAWTGVFAVVVFSFLAYQLYDVVQSPAMMVNNTSSSTVSTDTSLRPATPQNRGYYRRDSAAVNFD